MNLVKFFRGVKANYNATSHADALYFATDTHELIMNGASYGDTISSVAFEEVASGENKGKVLGTITLSNGTTIANIDTQSYGRNEIDAIVEEINATATANKIANADGSIKVTDGTDGTDINVNIKSGEKVIKKDGNNGIYTNFKIEKLANATDANTAASYELVSYNAAGDAASRIILGDRIDVAKDQLLKSAQVVDASGKDISAAGAGVAKYLRLTFIIADGSEDTRDIDIASFVQEAEAGNGLAVTNGVINVVKAAGSEDFLKINADSISIEGVQDAIDTKAANLAVSAQGEDGYLTAAVDANNNKKINVTPIHLTTATSDNDLTLTITGTGLADEGDITNVKKYVDAHDTKINTRVSNLSGQSGETYAARTVGAGESSYISTATNIQDALNKLDDVAVAHTALLTWNEA